MFNYIYLNLILFFKLMPLALLVFFLITCISFCLIFILVCLVSMDVFYRPSKEYPYSIVLDRVVPVFLLLAPFIIMFTINPVSISWVEKFSYIILMHTLIIIPLMKYWSDLRGWFFNEPTSRYWSHPGLYFKLTLAMIYPMIWCIYFSGLRYLRLGTEIDINKIIDYVMYPEIFTLIFIFILSSINLMIYILILIQNLLRLKIFLWNHFSIIIYSLHFKFLRYNFYFYVIEKIFKLFFVVFTFVSLATDLNYKMPRESYSWFRRLLNKIYYNPRIIYIFILIMFSLEICFSTKLVYIYYILFWFSILFGICKIISAIGMSKFILDVCKVDYLKQDLNNIRYPTKFWIYIEAPQLFYGITKRLSDEDYSIWKEVYAQFSEKNDLYSTDLINRLFDKIDEKYKNKAGNIFADYVRIKVIYYKVHRIRWNYKFNT